MAKVARIIRGVNPTPVTMDEAMKNLVEEFTDVQRADKDTYDMKYKRWYDRLREAGYVWKTETA